MGTNAKRVLPTNEFLALVNANAPSNLNPFATLADIAISSFIQVVDTFSTLPNPTTVSNTFFYVENSQGTSWLPWSLGGTYYPSGLYYSNGTDWIATETPYQATQAEVNLGSNTNKFVTPETLLNSTQWDTKLNVFESQDIYKDVAELIAKHPPNGSNEIQLDNETYIFDSQFFDLTGYTLITHPDGTTIKGFSQNINTVFSSEDNISLIKGTGNLFLIDINFMVTGLNSQVIDLTDSDGTHSLDAFYASFVNCTKIGTMNGYRQGFIGNGFAINCGEGLTMQGSWGGGFTIFSTRIINVGNFILSGDAGFTCNAIRSNVNATIPIGAVAFDFDYDQILTDGGYQIENGRFDGDGLMVSQFTSVGRDKDNPWESRKSFFSGNKGSLSKNTFIGGFLKWTTETLTSLTLNTPTKALGGTTYSNLTYLLGAVDNAFTHNSTVTTNYTVDGQITVSGGQNDVLRLTIRQWDNSASTYIDVISYDSVVNNFIISDDLAFFRVFYPVVTMDFMDRIEIWITNLTDNSDATVVNDSLVFLRFAG